MIPSLLFALLTLILAPVFARPLRRAPARCNLPTTTATTSTTTTTTSTSTSTSTTTTTATTSVTTTTTTSTSLAPATSPAVLDTTSDISGGPYWGGFATYFYQNGNPGACGQYHSDWDFICAMDQARFGTSGPASSLCNQQVNITNTDTGHSIVVTVVDDCPTCENGNSIDLAVGAFQALAPLSQGIFPIEWFYV